MKTFMILAIIDTEKDTLVFYSRQMLMDGGTDERTDGKLNCYIAPC